MTDEANEKIGMHDKVLKGWADLQTQGLPGLKPPEVMFRFLPDGGLWVNPACTTDEAAAAFWAAVRGIVTTEAWASVKSGLRMRYVALDDAVTRHHDFLPGPITDAWRRLHGVPVAVLAGEDAEEPS